MNSTRQYHCLKKLSINDSYLTCLLLYSVTIQMVGKFHESFYNDFSFLISGTRRTPPRKIPPRQTPP